MERAGVLLSARSTQGVQEMGEAIHPETLRLTPHDWVPNHPWLPVLIYRDVPGVAASRDSAATLESLFGDHGWQPRWRSAVYDFHHYHSTAHEVLGVAHGTATLVLGGPGGNEVEVRRGDVILLPAGTGHRQQRADEDFLVVGAYPPEQTWDICRSAPTPAMLERIQHLPFPASDPVAGADGPMVQQWSRAMDSHTG
jgi:uncharacterized protein YjlB